MERKFLEVLGLDKELIDKIMDSHSTDIGKHVQSAKDLQSQIDAANKEIAGYKGLDIDGIKQKAAEWEQKATAAEQAAAQVRFDGALTAALTSAKARNPKAVRALLDESILKLADNNVVGLQEQLDAIRKDNSYLFEAAPKEGAGFSGATPPGEATNTSDYMNSLIKGQLKGE